MLKIYKVIYRNERGTVMHILIAEDHPDLRKILTLYLQKEGYQVSVVSNGQEAITYLMERCGLKVGEQATVFSRGFAGEPVVDGVAFRNHHCGLPGSNPGIPYLGCQIAV